MKHIPRKRFGQHFLTDQGIIEGIVQAIAPRAGQAVVEIGPGLAALTQPLVERLGHLTVIELDRDLAQQLRAHPQLTVVESDVLKVDFRQLAERLQHGPVRSAGLPQAETAPKGLEPAGSSSQQGPRDWLRQTAGAAAPSRGSAVHEVTSVGAHKLRVVGNLPYNISTPILFHLLDAVDVIEDQHFMLQKEVIDRMVAAPSTSDYGRLSVMLQWRYAMENVLFVPPQSFDPPPRVDSAVVRMVPHAHPAALDVKLLSQLVQVAFSQRRKLLRHTLGQWLTARGFPGAFDVQRRAEEVPVAEYVALAQQVAAMAV
ncbi:ribosomal RNA small subunit methyltransferase A [Polaromonas sp. JS666]|uniref:ribosomal RNA small subunit methyltransferase A n=1 Tax=Polaromonas sp. (strain JS666 / ATCC BAA-500) TaxID=296591 RepID=UPI0000463D0C|nr:rRNA adenine dimethyltransferase family protein [Polaromonas sp. JS666]